MRVPTDDEINERARRLGAKLDALALAQLDYQPSTPTARHYHRIKMRKYWLRKWIGRGE